MFIPGGIVGAGVADASGTGGPGFIVGGGGVGAIVMPGVGAIVGAGDAFAGTGVLLCSGAGVIRMPGMGAMVGSAATPGAAVRTIENVTTAMRVASKVASAVRIGVREMPRERPRMAFQVRCLITAVTPRLIGKFLASPLVAACANSGSALGGDRHHDVVVAAQPIDERR
jgi:hypothetical protein